MTTTTLNLFATKKLNSDNYATWKNIINIVLIIDELRFILIEECPQVPPTCYSNVREAYKQWVKANEKVRAYILARLPEVLAKKHEPMFMTREIMESLIGMLG
ncbi:uncharacterized protein LOC120090636 [Benincasa hispida]|uniref:uncharacterized protein LOC120090636 n=1 Tax=Benincasa hispida TaxID=102211 RepID=UPI0018FFB14F|nr:uncharacterized protein LOC120090636 [Benincasa hispida]